MKQPPPGTEHLYRKDEQEIEDRNASIILGVFLSALLGLIMSCAAVFYFINK